MPSETRIICTTLPYDCPVPPPKIDRILSVDTELQPLVAKTRDLRALRGLVDGFLPPDLARHARVANFRDGELVLLAANAAAAAKLRLLAGPLSAYLSERRWQVNSVALRVQPNGGRGTAPTVQKTVQLSTLTLERLRGLHERMKPSPAREALGRLLARSGGRKGGE
jgi:hypothetical protein